MTVEAQSGVSVMMFAEREEIQKYRQIDGKSRQVRVCTYIVRLDGRVHEVREIIGIEFEYGVHGLYSQKKNLKKK